MKICPNYNSDYWKELVKTHGEAQATVIWVNEELNNNKTNTTQVKEGVSFVFEQNKELSNIGTQLEYSNYLDGLFPNSKLKDVLYHGTRTSEKFEQFDETRIGELDSGYFGRGFYFSPDLSYANGYSKIYNGNNMAVIVNLQNPLETDANNANTNISLENNDGSIVRVGENLMPELSSENYDPNEIGEVVIKSSNQIHVLGSKKDIEGFKNYVNNKNTNYSIDKSNNKPLSLEQKVKSFQKALYPIEKNNNDIIIDTSNEFRRKTNVEIQDSEGEFTGNFFDLEKQSDTVDTLFNLVFEESIKNNKNNTGDRNKDLKFKDIYDIVIYNFNELIDSIDEIKSETEGYTQEQLFELSDTDKFNLSLYDNLDTFVDIVNSNEQFLDFVERKFDNLKINVDEINESLLENSDYGGVESRSEYVTNEERDSKETMSERIKMFLSTMPKYEYDRFEKKIVISNNSIGFPNLSNFQELYEQLSFKFANIPELNLDKINEILLKDRELQPSLYQIAQRLNNSEDRIKNEFVTALKRINVTPYITFFTKEIKGGFTSYITRTTEGNRSRINNKLIQSWKENQRFNEDVLSKDGFGNLLIDKSIVSSLKNKIDELNAIPIPTDINKQEELKEQYKLLGNSILKLLGIDLSTNTLLELYDNSVFLGNDNKPLDKNFNKSFIGQFGYGVVKGETYPIGVFSGLVHVLEGKSRFNNNLQDETISVENPLYNDLKNVKFLANLEAKYTNETESNYINLEGKNIFSFILPSFESNQLMKIIDSVTYRKELEKDLMASHSYLFKIINRDNSQYKLGLFDGLKNTKVKTGITRDNSSFRENMMSELYQFENDKTSNANYFDLVKSDKKTTLIHTGVPKIDREFATTEYLNIFKAEYIRVINADKLNQTKQLSQGSKIFYFLEEFNYEILTKLKNVETGFDLLTEDEIKLIYASKDEIITNITFKDKQFRDVFNKIINNKILTLYNDYIKQIKKENVPIDINNPINDNLIYDFVFNKNIFNMSISMLISGDVNSFYKAKKEDVSVVEKINRTFDTYTKRLAKDIASGTQGNFQDKTYSALTITVPETYAKEYSDLLLNNYYGLKGEKGQIDGSDASQFCTIKRYFQILYDYGRVTKDILVKAQNLGNDEFLSDDLLEFIAPIKPVEVDKQYLENNLEHDSKSYSYSYIHYVKSSLIPLVPNYLAGLEMDNLRKLMNEKQIDHVSLDTAGKAGNPIQPLSPFDINNNWIYNEETDKDILTGAKRVMNSDSFYIQQELPSDETKEKITFITQLNKLVGDTLGMITSNTFDFKGRKLTGNEIITEKERIRNEMLTFSFDDLKDQIGIDENGIINIEKFREYIVKNSDDLTANDLDNLEIKDGRFKIPLLLNGLKNQIESKLASAVRKAIQVKINGKSFVQITSLGFKRLDKSGVIPTNLIRTKGWDGDKLRPLRPVIKEIHEKHGVEIYVTEKQLEEHNKGNKIKLTKEQRDKIVEYNVNGKLVTDNNGDLSITILPAEIVIPFNFFDKKGNRVDINNFINKETGEVEMDEELLKLVGARIPNQSHSSQLPMKIVAFLPTKSDIIYVPAEITKQMGSDFDIDKLYVYKKKYKIGKEYVGFENIKEVKARVKELQLLLKDETNKLTDEELATVKEKTTKYKLDIQSEKYLTNLKVKAIDELYDNETIDSDLIDSTIEKLSVNELVELRKLSEYQLKKKYNSKNKLKIAKIIIDIDSKYSEFVYSSVLGNNLVNVKKKEFFQSVVNEIKPLQEKIKQYGKLSFNKLSSDLTGGNLEHERNIEDTKNDYFDVLYNILINTNLFNKVMQPLDMNDLKDVVDMRVVKNNSKSNDLFSPIRQIELYTSNVGVKKLVGTFSLTLTFNTLLQRTENIDLSGRSFRIGNIDLNTISGLGRSNFKHKDSKGNITDIKRTTSDNVIMIQSEAVDNANNQVVDKINLADETSFAYLALLSLKNKEKVNSQEVSALGNEYASQLINNQTIKEYVSYVRQSTDMFNDAKGINAKVVAIKKMGLGNYYDLLKTNHDLTDNDLGIIRDNDKNIIELKESPIDKVTRLKIIVNFIKLDLLGGEIFNLMNLTNVDTKGFGTNIIEGIVKQNKTNRINDELTYLTNVDELFIKDDEITELGFSNNKSFDILNSVSPLFNYNILDSIVSTIESNTGKQMMAREIRKLSLDYNSYVYSSNIFWNNSESEKRRLLFSRGSNKSLAVRIVELKEKYPQYLLFHRVRTVISSNDKLPSYITYNSLDYDKEKDQLNNEFFVLLNSNKPEIIEVVKDIIRYNYITGGNSKFNSVSKLIPSVIINNNISNYLHDVVNDKANKNTDFDNIKFIRQFYQHNIELTKSINFGKNKEDEGYGDYLKNNLTIPHKFFKNYNKVLDFFNIKVTDEEGNESTGLYEIVDKITYLDKDGNQEDAYQYIRIDVLGDRYINEYQFNQDGVNSIIKKNQSPKGIHLKDIIDVRFNDFEIKKEDTQNILGFINTTSLSDSLNNLLYKVKNQELEKEILSEAEKNTDLINLLFVALVNQDNKSKIVSSNSNYFNGKNIYLDFESNQPIKNLLHETVHAVTADYINKNPNNIYVYQFNRIMNDAKSKLTLEEQAIVNEFRLVNNGKNEDKESGYNKIKEKHSNRDLNSMIYYYALSDTKEFASALLTDKYVQNQLNNIESFDRNVSLFQKFKDVLNKILKSIADSLGIEIKENSLLYEAVDTIVSIINVNNMSAGNTIGENLFSIAESKSKLNSSPLQDVIHKLEEIKQDIRSEKEDYRFTFINGRRIKQLSRDIELLKVDNKRDRVGNEFRYVGLTELDHLLSIGEKHYTYIDDLIKKYNTDYNSVDEIYNAIKLFELWDNIKESIPEDYKNDDRIRLLQSRFNDLSEPFYKLRLYSFINDSKLNKQIELKDLTTDLVDTNIASQLTLASSRSSNLAIQAINKSLNNAKINTVRNNRIIKEKLTKLQAIVDANSLDLSDLLNYNNDISDSKIDGFINLVVPYNSNERDRFINYKKTQVETDKHNSENISFDLNNLFTVSSNFEVSLIEGNRDIELNKMANKINNSNKPLVIKVLNDLLIKQKELIERYLKNVQIVNEELKDGVIQQVEYNDWIKNNNPFKYNPKNNVHSKFFLLDVPMNNWNQKYEKVFANDKLLSVYDEVSTIMSDLISILPEEVKRLKNSSFFPAVNKALIREKDTVTGELKKLVELPKLTASDVFENYDKIPLKFVDSEQEDNLLKSKMFSTNLLETIKLFSETVNHNHYFNQIKANVLLGQRLLKESTPSQKDYKGNNLMRKGKEVLHKQGEGIEKELELLDETINFEMYLAKTKPEIGILNKFDIQLENFDNLIQIIDFNILDIDNKMKNLNYNVFSKDELKREREIIDNIKQKFEKDKDSFSRLNLFKDKIKAKYNTESYESVETLYNYYMSKLDSGRESYNNKEINFESYKILQDVVQNRIRQLNRSTIYVSKIVDWAIKQRRSISLGLNPFSATRNYIGGIFNGIINGGLEYDNNVFLKNVLAVSNLMTFKHNSDEAYKMYKIAKNLTVLEDLVDLQGMGERQWFDKYGFMLMEKSEQAVRLALMKSILEKDGLYDTFDQEGNINLDNDALNNIILKIQRTNDIVMGDTHSYKMINKSFFGRAVGQFKSSWLPEAIANRFESQRFDDKLNRDIKGRYVTYSDLGILGSLIGIVKVYQSWITGDKSYKNLRNNKTNEKISDLDAINLSRNTIELTMILALMGLGAVLRNLADDDEDNAPLVFLNNQISLIQRDLTTASPTVIVELLGGNAVPSLSVFLNIYALIPASIKLVSDDDYEFSKFMYKVNKVIPVLNILSQYEYQSQHYVDDLN